MSTILITGGTGLIGTALTKMLIENDHSVIVLTRDKTKHQQQHPNISHALWDIPSQTIDIGAVKKADRIIHLAGANVAGKRWTKKRKKEIVDSRVQSAKLLVKALQENENKVRSVFTASGIGWYGPDNPAVVERGGFVETDPAADDFLGQTCLQWEQSLEPVTAMGKRLAKFRQGIVLSNEGGALQEFKKPMRTGIAAILGSGRQIMSWIHIQDLCRLYLHALEHEQLHGAYNAVAHQPVSNKTFMMELAKRERGKFALPMHVPSFILKLVLGEMSIEVLKSTTVNNEKTRHTGFKFLYPSIEAALNQLQGNH
ncbi:MAG TPA: TIGR01777 family oxidoreductase [Chitinophagaceae bacterium]|nr:TIGR01777 family oxidoreductase [Chitinophagaceae bacterium]